MRATIAATFVCALTLAVAPHVQAAQGLDCKKPLQRAQSAIDKVTDDMKGMDTMPKEQVTDVNALLDEAKSNLEGAHQSCDKAANATEQARGIAKAEAAHGYAVAADKLHFHFMKDMKGMGSGKAMSGMKGSGNDMKGMSGTKSAGGETKAMSDMKGMGEKK
jgi:hypothetical protein